MVRKIIRNDITSIICTSIGPESPAAEIRAWVEELRGYPESDDVRLAIAQARERHSEAGYGNGYRNA